MKKYTYLLVLLLLVITCPLNFIYADETATETIIIRNGDTLIYQNQIPLPETGTISITDKNGTAHSINAQSVLGLLYSIDQSSDEFSISDIEYYASFNSLYLKCITPLYGAEICDNWQYAVGSTTPQTGIETTILTGGETVGLYFGSQHRLRFDTTTITGRESILTTAESYNYINNVWETLTNGTIGVTTPNPNDQYNPIIISTTPLSSLGTASITINNEGSYNIGIAEDYYFPSYQITVNPVRMSGSVPQTKSETEQLTLSSHNFDISSALSYLKNSQSNDGSFGDENMYTDWAAIAYGAVDISDDSKIKLLSYMTSHNKISPLLTDNERRAMALLALGQNPYAFKKLNYIDAIIKSFDGTQFGDSSLINDDIFALIPLIASGHTVSDEIIVKDAQFILLKQKSNGSWEESVDLTSATIQALSPLQSILGVSNAIKKAGNYISSEQKNNGGWNGVSSTSWAMQAENTLDVMWLKNGNRGQEYLALNQSLDGGMLTPNESLENRIWATSYAIPAILGKPWSTILHPIHKQIQLEQNILENQTQNDLTQNKPENIIQEVKDVPESVNKKIIPTSYNTKVGSTEITKTVVHEKNIVSINSAWNSITNIFNQLVHGIFERIF